MSLNDKIMHWIINVDEERIIRRTTFWNLIASLINAGYSAVLMFLIGRIIGMDGVGVFSIASAYGYQCLMLGAFGVRNIQASDVHNEFSFSDYFYLRLFSGLLMYLLLIYYTFFQGYSFEKIAVILCFGIFKSIEAFEDLYHGEYHRYNRLDIGCIMQATRYIISLILFTACLILTANLVLSFAVSTGMTIIVCIVQNKDVIKHYVSEKRAFHKDKITRLFLICLPLCISTTISMYIVNMPKYAIDAISDDMMQSVYGILILPVVTINLISVVIYRPILNTLSRHYYDGKFQAFLRTIWQQIGIIAILTIIITLGGYFIGLRLLEFIYGTALMQEMPAFLVMLIAGGANTIGSFLVIVLTIQRAQNTMLISYVVTIILGITISNTLVIQYGIMGASLLYLLLSLCSGALFAGLIYFQYKKKKQTFSMLKRGEPIEES